MTAIDTLHLKANGLQFAARTAGSGPLVLCLHGFPDSADTFGDLLPRLAGAGYQAVAPFMRGYAPTQIPKDGDYRVGTLGRDAIALADALNASRFAIVGHDWGAATACAAAALAPQRVSGIVTAAVPPLRKFVSNMRLGQLRRSWYMGFFHIPWLADAAVARNNCALIERLWSDWSPGWHYTANDIAPVKRILSQPQCRRAALSYYRAMLPVLAGAAGWRERKTLLGQLDVSARIIFGRQDGCIGPDMFRGAAECFSRASDVHGLDAGHFMHRELPDAFAELTLEFLSRINPGVA